MLVAMVRRSVRKDHRLLTELLNAGHEGNG
jgi:hypothetical protein